MVACEGATVTTSAITGNQSPIGGGIVTDTESVVTLTSCTISGNHAFYWGGGIAVAGHSETELQRVIAWGNCADASGDEAWVQQAELTFSCCNVNDAGLHGSFIYWNGNQIWEDPQFCNPHSCEAAPSPEGDYSLRSTSPALAASNAVCPAPIGAFGLGCEGLPEPLAHAEEGRLGPNSRSLRLRLAGVNPVSSVLRYEIDLPVAGNIDLAICDGSGRMILARNHPGLGEGRHTFSWAPGEPVLSRGVYFLIARSEHGEAGVRFIWNP
jgi:hypothetical protein